MKAKNKLLTLLILSTGAVSATAVINKCIKEAATAKKLLNVPVANIYKWRFGNIHYTVEGTGKPLLLIHDLAVASSSYEWSQLVNYLKEKYTVYSIDLLGCGLSEKPNLTYTTFLYVQLISDFIKSEIGRRTDVIATGAAGAIPIMACNQTPELFDKIMLINPDSFLLCSQIPGPHAKLYKFFLDLPIIGTLLYHMSVSKKVITEEFANNYYFDPYAVKASSIEAYRESAHLGESPKSLYASVRCNYTKCNISNALKKIDNSIYIVGGAGINGMEDAIKEYQECNPAIESTMISNSKFLPQLENPAELNKIIQTFLCS